MRNFILNFVASVIIGAIAFVGAGAIGILIGFFISAFTTVDVFMNALIFGLYSFIAMSTMALFISMSGFKVTRQRMTEEEYKKYFDE